MKLYYPLTIDLYKLWPLPVMTAQQNNAGRGAAITLTAAGQVIELEGEEITFYVTRPDGTISYLPATISGTTVYCDFTTQMLAKTGTLQVEVLISGGTEDAPESISTPIFQVIVQPSNIDSGAIESQNEFTALQQALAEIAELKQNGLKGDPGEAATVSVGTVTASAPGSSPQISNSGTSSDAVFDFVLPRGEPGSTGGFFGARSTFPETGTADMLYVDNVATPPAAYIWDGNTYVAIKMDISVSDGTLMLGTV